MDEGEGFLGGGRLSGLEGMILAWGTWFAIEDHDDGLRGLGGGSGTGDCWER